jgi:hypothetical protein
MEGQQENHGEPLATKLEPGSRNGMERQPLADKTAAMFYHPSGISVWVLLERQKT